MTNIEELKDRKERHKDIPKDIGVRFRSLIVITIFSQRPFLTISYYLYGLAAVFISLIVVILFSTGSGSAQRDEAGDYRWAGRLVLFRAKPRSKKPWREHQD